MTEEMVRCSACGTPHGSIEDATVCCEKDKLGVVEPMCDDCKLKYGLNPYFYFCRKYHDTPGGVKGYNHAPYCEYYEGPGMTDDKPGVVGLEVTPRTSGDGMIYEFNLRLWNYSTLSGTLYVFSRGPTND